MLICELDDSCEYLVVTFDLSGSQESRNEDYSYIDSEFEKIGLVRNLGGKELPNNTYVLKQSRGKIIAACRNANKILLSRKTLDKKLLAKSYKVEL